MIIVSPTWSVQNYFKTLHSRHSQGTHKRWFSSLSLFSSSRHQISSDINLRSPATDIVKMFELLMLITWWCYAGPGDDMWLVGDWGLWQELVGLPWLLLSESESLALPPSMWVFMCLARWSERMNLLLQVVQANFFSPVWVLRCLCSSSDLVKRLPQNNQLHTKGLSPVCHLKWAFKWEVLP